MRKQNSSKVEKYHSLEAHHIIGAKGQNSQEIFELIDKVEL